MARLAMQLRGKFVGWAAVFLLAATLPASASTLTPATFTTVLCTSTCADPNTGTTINGAPPTSPNTAATFGTAGTPHGEAQITASPQPNPEILAAANATGPNADSRANISFNYYFEVFAPIANVPVDVVMHASLFTGGSSSGNGGSPWSSTANITIDSHLVESITADSVNHISPTLLDLTKTKSLLTDKFYLVELYVDAHAQGFSGTTANASAWIDPWFTTDVFGDSIIVSDFLGNSAAAPLPTTWIMLLSGFIGLGFFAYRGTKNNLATLAAI